MTPAVLPLGRNRRLLSSVALVPLLWPVDGLAQTASANPRGLDPIVVEGQTVRAAKPRATANAGSSRQRRAAARPVATPAPAPTQPTTTAATAPTFNLGTPSSTGSRLGLTPLQTPASVEVIRAEPIEIGRAHV